MSSLVSQYLLSVLIPAYNNFDQTKKIIENFCNEEDVSIIISDDSNDKEALQLENYINLLNKKNIIYNKRKNKNGPFHNHNDLLNLINGKFFLFAHLGEVYENQNFLEYLRKNQDAISSIILPVRICNNDMGIYRIVSSMQQKLSYYFLKDFLPLKNILSCPLPSIIFKSNQIEYFNPKLIRYVDVEWIYRMLSNKKKPKIIFYSQTIVFSLYKPSSITNSLIDIKKIIKNDYDLLFNNGYKRLIISYNRGLKYFINLIFYSIFFTSYSNYYLKLILAKIFRRHNDI